MTQYQRIISSALEIEWLFAVIESFFASRDYFVKQNDFPERIEFWKKGSFFAVHDINTTHMLGVRFTSVNDFSSIELTYAFPQCTGSLSVKSVEILNNDVDRLAMKLQLALSEKDAGPSGGAGGERGPGRVVILRKNISYCPFCGKRLNVSVTPPKCPFCSEKLAE